MLKPLRSAASLAGLACLLLAAAPAAAAGPPDFSGEWKLNRDASDDVEAKAKDAAGSQSMSGAPSWGSVTVLPWGSKFSEGQRVMFRDVLLAGVAALVDLKIEQTANEIKTIHGDAEVRIFNLGRASAGTAILTGDKVTRQARWKGEQLVLESSSGKLKTAEILTRYVERDQLIVAFHYEMELLKHPLDLKLVYDRAKPKAP